MFQCLTRYHGGTITFRGNQNGKITRVGKVSIDPYPSTDNVLFVEDLKHNLLSISQLCNSGYSVSFNNDEFVLLFKHGSPLFSTKRKGNLYKIRLGDLANQKVSCLPSVKKITSYGIKNLVMKVGG